MSMDPVGTHRLITRRHEEWYAERRADRDARLIEESTPADERRNHVMAVLRAVVRRASSAAAVWRRAPAGREIR
jgi:hypothetical protein